MTETGFEIKVTFDQPLKVSNEADDEDKVLLIVLKPDYFVSKGDGKALEAGTKLHDASSIIPRQFPDEEAAARTEQAAAAAAIGVSAAFIFPFIL